MHPVIIIVISVAITLVIVSFLIFQTDVFVIEQGSQGDSLTTYTNINSLEYPSGTPAVSLDILCDDGDVATGGGIINTDLGMVNTISAPAIKVSESGATLISESGTTPNAWRIVIEGTTPNDSSVSGYVVCLDLTP